MIGFKPQSDAESSVKDLIVNIVGHNWPLKIKQVHNILKKEFNCTKSYQAVYKAILELKKDSVITETENGWQLRIEWISSNYNLFHKLKDTYSKNIFSEYISADSDITTINFKTMLELDDFYFGLFENVIPHSKEKVVAFCLRHNWRPLLYPQKEYENLKKIQKKCYFICNGSTILDKWCADFEQKSGINIKVGEDYASLCDIYVVGDKVVQVYIPQEITERIDTIFNSSKEFNELNVNQIIKEVFEKNCKIVAVINSNKEVARQIKHQVMNKFKEDENTNVQA